MTCATLPGVKGSSRLLLAVAALIHLAMLVGWRWQMPLVPYFFDATVLSGGRGLDFYSIYQAGYNARHGADIYEGDPAQFCARASMQGSGKIEKGATNTDAQYGRHRNGYYRKNPTVCSKTTVVFPGRSA